MTELKYVAAGFLQDAEKLLEDFYTENSKQFSVFANIWRNHSFSLIFMGRGSKGELSDFTHEIFHVSAKFLTSSCPMRQVGVIYLLYALYRNQVHDPPLRIRLVRDQMTSLLRLRDALPFDEHKSFHYVVSYLITNSLDFVACPKPMGPTMTYKLTEDHKREDVDSILRFHAGLKNDMAELAESNILKETGDMFVQYAEMKKSLKVPGMVTDVAESFKEYIGRLESMLESSSSGYAKKSAVSGDIGTRRAELKSKAFGLPACPVLKESKTSNEDTNNDESGSDLPISQPYPLKRRVLKARRNVGRPKKVDKAKEELDDNLDRSRLKYAKKAQRKPKTKRHYYSKGEELKRMSYLENLKFVSSSASWKLFSDSEADDPEYSVGFLEEAIPVESNVADQLGSSAGLSDSGTAVAGRSNCLEILPSDIFF